MKLLTPWFDGSVKPARVGVYERDIRGFGPGYFTHWDGSVWGATFGNDEAQTNINKAARATKYGGGVWQCAPWRGLAKEPK